MKLNVSLEHTSYDIFIEKGILNSVSKYANLNRRVLIITDKGVPTKYLDALKPQCPDVYVYVIDGGETSKTLESHQKISEFMLEHKFTRRDLIIALGGGVIGDLSGFVASTYMRGIDYISIPTTTLSQIDSSIGGKTAVNLGKVKNIIGAFYHPKMVFIDINTTKTLSKRLFNNGLVEALKAGLIYDPEIFDIFLNENIEENVEKIIYKSLLVKKDVVEQDEKEQHLRKILNFGHTIGHGIETYYNFKYFHGECVALGMMYMLKNQETKEKVRNILEKMSIETSVEIDFEKVFELMKRDKKANTNNITIVTVDKIGKADLEDVSFDTLYSILKGE